MHFWVRSLNERLYTALIVAFVQCTVVANAREITACTALMAVDLEYPDKSATCNQAKEVIIWEAHVWH